MYELYKFYKRMVGDSLMDKEIRNNYHSNYIDEIVLFNEELELTKHVIKQAIRERGNTIIQDIVYENKHNMIADEEKYIAEIELINQINKAIKDGNDELAAELSKTLKKKHNNI